MSEYVCPPKPPSPPPTDFDLAHAANEALARMEIGLPALLERYGATSDEIASVVGEARTVSAGFSAMLRIVNAATATAGRLGDHCGRLSAELDALRAPCPSARRPSIN